MMAIEFPAAPWPRTLKLTSAAGTGVVLLVVAIAYRTIPMLPWPASILGWTIALILPAIPILSACFTVTGYVLGEHDLYVKRLFSNTRIPLDGLSMARLEPDACKGAIRLFGNGGLYSFTGWYQSSSLGRFKLYGTDLDRSVVLALRKGTVVLTPENPRALVECLTRRIPNVNAAAESPFAAKTTRP